MLGWVVALHFRWLWVVIIVSGKNTSKGIRVEQGLGWPPQHKPELSEVPAQMTPGPKAPECCL
jgi:hypothetical protein